MSYEKEHKGGEDIICNLIFRGEISSMSFQPVCSYSNMLINTTGKQMMLWLIESSATAKDGVQFGWPRECIKAFSWWGSFICSTGPGPEAYSLWVEWLAWIDEDEMLGFYSIGKQWNRVEREFREKRVLMRALHRTLMLKRDRSLESNPWYITRKLSDQKRFLCRTTHIITSL